MKEIEVQRLIGQNDDSWLYEQKINAIIPVIRELEADITENAVYFAKGKSDSMEKRS